MKKTKRIAALLLTVAVMAAAVVSLTSCGKTNTPEEPTLICGVTDFDPMNYLDASGNWTGFDTEFARLVGDKLGMKVEFQLIDWGSKYMELESGAISAIWNGFTANGTDENSDGVRVPRAQLVDMSYSYVLNQQCVVARTDKAGEIKSIDDLKGKTVAVESGSAGEGEAVAALDGSGTILDVSSQVATFLEVKSGAADCAVVDILLAQGRVGTGDYADLVIIPEIEMAYEIYAIGFKKGDPLRDKVNGAIKELYDEGKLMELAEKYDLENVLSLDFSYKG